MKTNNTKIECPMSNILAIFSITLLFSSQPTFAQRTQNTPKIIVGIVVDQMRYDMLTRFQQNFGENGLKKLMRNGFFAENMHFNYCPTYTGPGHASIYTGTVPSIHGIAANDWINNGVQDMYCTQDNSVLAVGGNEEAGKMSPKNLLVTTITDQLRLFSNTKSKVIGIAIKDRGAILPAGHMANAAYWYDGKTGHWITSNYYMKSLPNWVTDFNILKRQRELMKSNWNVLLPIEKYTYRSQDNNPWEEHYFGKDVPTIPYTLRPEKYDTEIRYTPFGNTFTTEFAIAAIQNEHLGQGPTTDFLTLSYSSTDYIGHACGPYSLETEDAYYRLDSDIERLLNALDAQVGKDNYWLFMTADHGVQDVPAFSKSHNIPSGNLDDNTLKNYLNGQLLKSIGKRDIISHLKNEQIYIKKGVSISMKDITLKLNEIHSDSIPGIRGFYEFNQIDHAPIASFIKEKIVNGYYPNRSGDIAILLNPNWISHGMKGTSHGSPYSHDTHVPFLFYGKGVHPKSSSHLYHITDIAPTLSYLLGILQPNGCIGKPIVELEYLK
jgi:predicted AlkP superfamily pyrophosphatase or phosphodiesterase